MKQPMKIYGYSLTNYNVEKSEKTKAKRGERQTKKIKKNRGGMNVRCGVYSKGGVGWVQHPRHALAQREGRRQIIPIICPNGQKRYKTRLLGR